MSYATSFIEVRIAKGDHQCTQCGEVIGQGFEYKREAIPPWAYQDYDDEGRLVNYSIGEWIVIKRCYWCMGAAK